MELQTKKTHKKLTKEQRSGIVLSLIILGTLAFFLPILLFTGSLETSLDDTSLTVKASYWSDLTLHYEDIDSIEYRPSVDAGSRIGGFGSPKLLMGSFRNEEFGAYTRYTYAKVSPCIVLKVDGHVYVIGTEDDSELRKIYEKILVEISKDTPTQADT